MGAWGVGVGEGKTGVKSETFEDIQKNENKRDSRITNPRGELELSAFPRNAIHWHYPERGRQYI